MIASGDCIMVRESDPLEYGSVHAYRWSFISRIVLTYSTSVDTYCVYT